MDGVNEVCLDLVLTTCALFRVRSATPTDTSLMVGAHIWKLVTFVTRVSRAQCIVPLAVVTAHIIETMPRSRQLAHARRQNIILLTVISMLQAAWLAITLYSSQWYWKQPYHTSALTGAAWVNELVYGHPERIRNCQNFRE